MDQKERQETQHRDLYVVPVVGGAIVGYIIADWVGVSEMLGTGIGAFVVDAFRGLRGTHRFVREAEHLVQQARMVWERQKGQRPTREAPAEVKGPSQPPPGEQSDSGEIYPSA